VALLLISALALAAASGEAVRGWFAVLGVLLGVALYHASFGFTAAYRRLIVHRDIGGVTAQIVMLALAMLLFAPVLAQGEAFGQQVTGAVAPLGIQVAVGAFLFGLGMQLGGGCGSGTLFTIGGGSLRMLLTLVAFCAGGFWASLHFTFWSALPSTDAIALSDRYGWEVALPLQLGVLCTAWLALRAWAGTAAQRPLWSPGFDGRALVTGPWPLLIGAAALAVLNWLTLVSAGHPWSITWAFTLWGAKVAALLGWDPATSAFWSGGFQQRALAEPLLADTTTLMNIGIVLGALAAAALAGRFRPRARVPLGSLAAAVLGGLAMGYGARLAFGCNIGAFFSGVASTSLHGWLWILLALPGTWVGVRLRPWFRLAD
jgi:uncharacterized protein